MSFASIDWEDLGRKEKKDVLSHSPFQLPRRRVNMAYLFEMVAARAGFVVCHCRWLISGRPESSSGFSSVLGCGSQRPGRGDDINLVAGGTRT